MDIEGYEYKVQRLYDDGWYNTATNDFASDEWYPNLKNAKNALAQMRATRYGRVNDAEYRLVRRPYGKAEAIDL